MSKLLILVNYGGPQPGKERDYLFRLFSDPVVFPLPKPLPFLLGKLVAHFRRKETAKILQEVGGESPLLKQTEEQAKLLKELLKDWEIKVAMRYSEPLLENLLKEVKEKYQKVVILPLFPHYSVATWGTVERIVKKHLPEAVFVKPFYSCEGFINGWVNAIRETVKGLKNPFLLFSAHSLPLYLVNKYKDPYPSQVKESAFLIAERLNLPFEVSYQSKLGPVKWLSPSTEETIKRLSEKGIEELVVIPISFVSENTETLQEIDIYYSSLARELGIKTFKRVKIPYNSPEWISCFKKLVGET
jgi:ferrochelatase